MPHEKRQVPRGAVCFRVGDFELGDNGEESKSAPFRMVARSGQPIEHWYWGNVVHDLSGMRHKGRVPIDYAHDEKEVIGYANHFATNSGDLELNGALVPFKDSDRATEIIHKQKAGIPYEASINFGGDGIKLEQVGEGQTVDVNGYKFNGPGIVIREWPLRGVAICPYGADGNTSTEFSESETVTVEVHEVSHEETKPIEENQPQPEAEVEVEATTEAVESTEAVDSDTTAEASEEAVEASPEPVETTELSQGQRFLAAFGDQGGVWFAQGKSFDEAQALFTQALVAENEKLKAKLSAIQQDGESEPVKFSEANAGGSGVRFSDIIRPKAKGK